MSSIVSECDGSGGPGERDIRATWPTTTKCVGMHDVGLQSQPNPVRPTTPDDWLVLVQTLYLK